MKSFKSLFCLLLLVVVFGSQAQTRYLIQDYTNASSLKAATIVPKSNDKVFLKYSKCLLVWDAVSTAFEDTLFGIVKQNSITTGRWIKIEPSKSKIYPLSSNVTTTITTRNPVTEWGFPTIANKRYLVEIVGSFQTSALTTGISIGFTTPTGAGTIMGYLTIPIVQNSATSALTTSIYAISSSGTLTGSFLLSTAVNPSNGAHWMTAKLIYTCTATGTFQVNFGGEVAGSTCTLLAGSIMTVTPL